jgi:Leucine-rich repeat (LRR) protein
MSPSLCIILPFTKNQIKDWAEVDRLGALARLEDLLLVGNPLHVEARDGGSLAEYRVEVCALKVLGVLWGC